jgi:hypothetical protein
MWVPLCRHYKDMTRHDLAEAVSRALAADDACVSGGCGEGHPSETSS